MTQTQTFHYQAGTYSAVKERFGLKWRQRDALDASPAYELIMTAAARGLWDVVEGQLRSHGIIE